MSTRAETNLFSTSFIDMICVALCGQIILWVIASDQEPARVPSPPRMRYFEIVQFGRCHLCEGQLPGQKFAYLPATLSVNGVEKELNFRVRDKRTPECDRIDKATLQWLDAEPGRFTGGLRILAPPHCQPFRIKIPVGACEDFGNKPHYVRAESSLLGKTPVIQYFLSHMGDDLPGLTAPVLPEDRKSFADKMFGLPTEPVLEKETNTNYKAGYVEITVPATGPITVKSVDGEQGKKLTKKFQNLILGN